MLIRNGNSHHTLNFWIMPNAGFDTRWALEDDIKEFERRNPGVRINLQILPWSLAWNRIMDVVKGRFLGPKPDVLQVGTTWVATLASLGALDMVPDSSVLPDEDRQSAYIWDPGAQSENGEELYCVPWFIDVRTLYYRRDVFEKIGVDPARLQDWAGFFKACLEIKKKLKPGGPLSKIRAPLGMPGQKAAVLMHDLAPWIWGAGGDFVSEDQGEGALSSPEALRGCEFYFDLINQEFMEFPDNDFEFMRMGSGFFTGDYAMQFSGAWPIQTYLNGDHKLADAEVVKGFDVALFPSGPQGRYTFLGGSNLAVTSFGQRKQLSWDFIRYLSEPERQTRHAKAIGALTARLASMESLFSDYPKAKKIFWDSLGHARRLPRMLELGSIEQIISKTSAKVLDLIRAGEYNHRRLHEEILAANGAINSVLSLHRYGTKVAGGES